MPHSARILAITRVRCAGASSGPGRAGGSGFIAHDRREASIRSGAGESTKGGTEMASETLTSEEVRGAHRAAWLLMIVGLLSIAVGVIVLLKPSDSLVTLVVITGIFVLIDGAGDVFGSFSRSTENRGLAAVVGVVSIVVGVLLIRHPFGGVLAAALLIGIWLIAAGTVRVVRAFDRPHRAWGIVVGVIEVAAGI